MPATVAAPFSLVPALRANSGLIFNASHRPQRRTAGRRVTVCRDADVGSSTPSASARQADLAFLIIDACEAAMTAIGSLETQARDVARQFRFAPGVNAQRGLAHLVESTQSLLRLASMTAGAAELDLGQLCERAGQAAVRLQAAIASAIRAQLVHDWDALAMVLDGEMVYALAGWRRVFTALVEPFDSGPTGHAA